MGLRSFIEKRVYSDAPAPLWERDFPSLMGWHKTASGKTVSQHSATRMIAVYACQAYIADGVSTLPVEHFRKVKGLQQAVPLAQTPKWITQPNPYQTAVDFWHRVVISLLSDGNAFIYTARDPGTGMVVALYCLHPDQVVVLPGHAGNNTYSASAIELPELAGMELTRADILHIPAFSVGGYLRGLSPIDIAREAIGLGMTMEEFGGRFFAQGTTMAGIIEHPGTPKTDEAILLREMFKKSHSGIKNSHAVGVLTGGAVFKPITITPEQAQFLESRRFQNTQIALLYRVPAFIVDPTITSTWGTGIGEQRSALVTDTFMPWAIRIEQAVSTFLLPGPQYIKFNFDARMRPKTAERYTAHAQAINNGFMNIDEVRAIEDLPPLPNGEGQKYFRPRNHEELGFNEGNLDLAKPVIVPTADPAGDPNPPQPAPAAKAPAPADPNGPPAPAAKNKGP